MGSLNDFYNEFLELSIQTNLDLANQLDVNDGDANEKSASKVSGVFLIIFSLLGLQCSSFPDCCEWIEGQLLSR